MKANKGKKSRSKQYNHPASAKNVISSVQGVGSKDRPVLTGSNAVLANSEFPGFYNDLKQLQDAYRDILHERNMLQKTIYAIRNSFPVYSFNARG